MPKKISFVSITKARTELRNEYNFLSVDRNNPSKEHPDADYLVYNRPMSRVVGSAQINVDGTVVVVLN